MFQKVIYKRQYNKPTIEEIEAEIADEPIPAEVKEPAPSKDKCSSKDIFKQLNEGAVYVPLPERKPIAKAFISQAIEISENYQIDSQAIYSLILTASALRWKKTRLAAAP